MKTAVCPPHPKDQQSTADTSSFLYEQTLFPALAFYSIKCCVAKGGIGGEGRLSKSWSHYHEDFGGLRSNIIAKCILRGFQIFLIINCFCFEHLPYQTAQAELYLIKINSNHCGLIHVHFDSLEALFCIILSKDMSWYRGQSGELMLAVPAGKSELNCASVLQVPPITHTSPPFTCYWPK